MLNYVASHLLTVRERERQYTCKELNRKIENSSNCQELVLYPMPEEVDEWSSSVRIKFQQPFPDSY